MQKSIKGLLCGTILIAALGLTGCGNNAQSDLEEVVGMNKEQSTSAIEVLKNAGISDVESVQKVPNATNLYELRSEKYGAFFMKVMVTRMLQVTSMKRSPFIAMETTCVTLTICI